MRPHRVAVPIVLVLAVVTGFLAVFSLWVKRQTLDTENWTDTSQKLLAEPEIQNALGTYLVTQLFSNIDVESQLKSVLPPQVQGLAGPVSGGLRSLAEERVPKLLARPRVQDAWVSANRTAHKELLAILDDKGTAVSTGGGDVVLNTRPLIQQLADDVGIGGQVASISPQVGQLVIMKSDELATAQDVAKGVRNLSIALTIISLGLFALAVWLARGRRRVTLRTVGWCFVGIGAATLLIRRVTGNAIVDGLVQNESAKDAAHEVFLIGSSLLYSIAVAMIIYGLVIVAAAWIAGPSSWGVAARRWLAPTLIHKPGVVYGTAGFVYLIVLAWGPTPAFRNFLPIVLIGILLVVGIEALRRQAAREFPDGEPAHAGGPPAGADIVPDKDVALGPS
jgi:hypothetical protein